MRGIIYEAMQLRQASQSNNTAEPAATITPNYAHLIKTQ
jgi:hypothetical protein